MNLLAEDLMQLTSDDDGVLADQWNLDSMLAGSVLADLVFLGAIEFVPRTDKDKDPQVRAVPAHTIDDALLNSGYELIKEKTRRSSATVEALSKGLRASLLARIKSQGFVGEPKQKRFLGIFPYSKWRLISAAPRDRLRTILTQSLISEEGPGPRTAALLALLNTIDRLGDGISADAAGRNELLERAERLATESSVGDAVNESLRVAIAATIAAVTTSIVVTSTIASGAATS